MTSARSLLSLLFNASKALDVVQTALELGVLEALDAGPVTLRELSAKTGALPNRMYKFLDCLESIGFVVRTPRGDDRLDTSYRASQPLTEAARAVLGPESLERDRDRYDWRVILGRLPETLRGKVANETFAWPPATDEQVRSFESSMSVGCAPIVEAFLAARAEIFPASAPCRWLDVGGGDGTLALGVLGAMPNVTADVFNLPSTCDLIAERARTAPHGARLQVVPGDFFAEDLPGGYDVVSFVRVLHDWDEARARALLAKGVRALKPGGRIVICEEFRTGERLAVQFFWTYFLMGVDACESRLRDVAFYTDELRSLGREHTTVVPGAFDLVVGT